MSHETLSHQTQKASAVAEKQPQPLPQGHLGKIDTTKSQPREKEDGTLVKGASFDSLQTRGNGFGAVAVAPGLSYRLLGLLDTDMLRREGHLKRPKVQPVLGAREALILEETIIERGGRVRREESKDSEAGRP
jgi:hypothetical protein